MRWLAVCLYMLTCSAAFGQTLQCAVSTKHRCHPYEGCQVIPNNISITIDVPKNIVSRCDAKGCDMIPVQVATSGANYNLVSSVHGYMLKAAVDGRYFSEMATLNENVFLSFGVCTKR